MRRYIGQIITRIPRRFLSREDGTVTIFGMMMFVLMVGVGGIAIDVMRYETQRAQLQYTLDRAVLAAASLSQTLEPEAVVRDYFETAGLQDYRLRVEVIEGLNFRRVNAIAEMELRSLFMHMFGVRVLTSPAAGAAEERVRNIEVSMVLDISGSMGSSNRMTNLRPAARQFVTDVMGANTNPEGNQLVSVSIIPYNGHVNAGSTLNSVFNLSDEHGYSNCSRFYDGDFNATGLSPNVEIQRMGHFDMNTNSWNQNSTINRPRCPTDDYGAIIPWSQNETALHALINSFNPEGTTAIDAGMKWAVALLDPAARPAVNALVESGVVHADFEDRPAPYDDVETLKVIVLMTDGANTEQYDLRDHVRTGPSRFWRDPDDGDISVYYEEWDEYWWEDHNEWHDEPDGGDNDNAYQMDWSEVWNRISVNHIDSAWFPSRAWDLDGDTNNSVNHWRRDVVEDNRDDFAQNRLREQYANGNEGDDRLEDICDAAHAQGIVIFSIAFEAPSRGRQVMQYCASSDAHYYDVEGLDISDAFSSIARTINQLRLVQ